MACASRPSALTRSECRRAEPGQRRTRNAEHKREQDTAENELPVVLLAAKRDGGQLVERAQPRDNRTGKKQSRRVRDLRA